jgi:hypothetical protein
MTETRTCSIEIGGHTINGTLSEFDHGNGIKTVVFNRLQGDPNGIFVGKPIVTVKRDQTFDDFLKRNI